jgi:hypothetical protein
MVKRLKIHHDHEFDLLMALGASLPGAIRALPTDELPQAAINYRPGITHAVPDETPIKF